MLTDLHPRTARFYGLILALLFQGLSGVGGGIALVVDPTGGFLGLPVSWLQGSPFSDYLVPGLILLCVLGIFPLAVVYGLWIQRNWAWFAALLVGLALMVWIGVELLVVGYQSEPPLQTIYGSLGVIILALTLRPAMKKYRATDSGEQ